MGTWSSKSVFCVFGVLVLKFKGFYEIVKETKQPKKDKNGDFQVVGSLLYAHYPIYFVLLLSFLNQKKMNIMRFC